MVRAGGILVLGERLHHGTQGHAAPATPSGEDSEDREDGEDGGRLRMVNLDNGTIVGTLLQDEPVRALKVQGILLAYTRGPDIGFYNLGRRMDMPWHCRGTLSKNGALEIR